MSVRLKWLSLWLLGVLAVPGGLLQAQPVQSVIQDLLSNANGTRFRGTAEISWDTFVSADGIPIAGNSFSLPVVDGLLNVQLVPTTDVQGAYYRVVYKAEGTSMFREYWSVPPSSQALKLKDIRIPAPRSGGSSGVGGGSGGVVTPPAVNTQITIADVANLQQELDVRPTTQLNALRGRVVYLSSSGSLDTVLGDSSECVRVDGSAIPCGSGTGGGAQLTFVDGELPAGSLNGSNGTFTLGGIPSPASSLRLYRNGLLLRQGADYNLTGGTINFNGGLFPQTGDVVTAFYRTSGASTTFVDGEIPTGAIDGINAQFALTATPSPVGSLQLYRSGILQRAGTDFILSGNVVVFTGGAIPRPGDTVVAHYRK